MYEDSWLDAAYEDRYSYEDEFLDTADEYECECGECFICEYEEDEE